MVGRKAAQRHPLRLYSEMEIKLMFFILFSRFLVSSILCWPSCKIFYFSSELTSSSSTFKALEAKIHKNLYRLHILDHLLM